MLTFYIIVVHFVFVFFFKTERLILEFLLFFPLNIQDPNVLLMVLKCV